MAGLECPSRYRAAPDAPVLVTLTIRAVPGIVAGLGEGSGGHPSGVALCAGLIAGLRPVLREGAGLDDYDKSEQRQTSHNVPIGWSRLDA
jgi:hypothetical protein